VGSQVSAISYFTTDLNMAHPIINADPIVNAFRLLAKVEL